MTHQHDKGLRKIRDRFKSLRTQIALREAVLDVPGITEFDLERILQQLWQRKEQYKDIRGFKETRAAFIDWAVRQAQLTVQLRTIFQGVWFGSDVVTLLFLRLPEFTGADEHFPAWVVTTGNRERIALDGLAVWITEHQDSVYAGIRSVLLTCADLDRNLEDVGDCLSSQVWAYVWLHPTEFSDSPNLRKRLKDRGYWYARAWKSKRLAEIATGEMMKASKTFFVGPDGVQKVVTDQNADDTGVVADEVIDVDALLNPIVIRERPWTYTDLEREMFRAGPFRADDSFERTELTAA